MANFSVSWDAAAFGRLDTAEATTNWNNDGASPTVEPDFFYQGSNCISCLVKTTEVGQYCAPGAVDMSTTPRVLVAKIIQSNYGAIDGNGLQLRIGSATGAYYYYYVFTATTYPKAGGWQVVVIDPNVAQWRTGTTGTPNLASVNYWGIRSDANATAKAANLGMDAVDVMNRGTGLSGTGADTTGSFETFRSTDEDTSTNSWGIVQSRGGILYVNGVLTIGASGGSAAATDFSDSNRVLVFPHHRVTTGFCGVDFDLGNASTTISITNCIFNGKGDLYTSDDTRPDYTVTNTSGSLTVNGCTFNVFRQIDLTSVCDWQNNTFLNGLLINAAGANLSGSSFEGCTGAADSGYVSWNVSTNPNGLLDNCSFVKGSTATHAISFGTSAPTTMTLVGHSYSGYNASDGQNDSTLYFADRGSDTTWTVNISGGDTPTYKKARAGDTVNIVSSVTVTLTGLVDGTEVRVYKTSDDSVVDGIESTSGGSWAFSAAASLGVYIRIFHVQYLPADIVGYTIPTTNASVPVQQVFDRNYSNP